MRSYKKIMPFFLVLILFASVAFSLNNRRSSNQTYLAALAEARDLAEKRIYTDSLAKYDVAISENPSVELSYEVGQVYIAADDYYSARKWYRNMVSEYPYEPLTYRYGLELNYTNNKLSAAIEVYRTYQERGLYSESIEEYVDQFRYMYKISGKYEDWRPFSNITGMAAVQYDGKWGYITNSGERALNFVFDEAGLFSELAPVVGDGYACYIDAKGFEKINSDFIAETDPDFGNVIRFGPYQGSAIWASNGKIWNAYKMGSLQKVAEGYQDVLPFSGNDLGAVSNGSKWALISGNGAMVTDFQFDEILADEKDAICRTSALLVRIGGVYKLADLSGNDIGDKTFTNAKAFSDGTYAAVLYNGKWCYIDAEGNIVHQTDYEEIDSFCNGFAAVKKDGKWGYIDRNFELCIPCVFSGAGQFNREGSAFILEEGYGWRLLSLFMYS